MNGLKPGQTCIVVGAGISGLMAARTLTAAGIRVMVLDKGRGVGGRMSTRRIDNAVFDHGAQFVTAREPVFSGLLKEWTGDGLIGEWSRGFPRPLDEAVDGHARYFVRHGMTALPKHLAHGLDVQSNLRVAGVSLDGKWRLRLTTGRLGCRNELLTADGLILTPPVPQSLDLLDLGGVELPASARQQLEAVRYDPCLTWMAFPTSDRRIGSPGAIQFPTGPLQFIADNQQKGISPEAAAITVHTDAEFSRRYFEADEIENWRRIVNQVAEFTGPVRRASFQRWRYARPTVTSAKRCVRAEMAAPLVFCGDAFCGNSGGNGVGGNSGGPRIEVAALSGLAAAQSIMGL